MRIYPLPEHDRILFQLQNKLPKMTDEFNRYYIKIRVFLGINPKTIFEGLTEALKSDDPHLTYEDIAVKTDLSRDKVERIIHDHLKMRKVVSR